MPSILTYKLQNHMEGGFTLKIGGFHRTMYKEYIMIPEYDQAYSQMVSFF